MSKLAVECVHLSSPAASGVTKSSSVEDPSTPDCSGWSASMIMRFLVGICSMCSSNAMIVVHPVRKWVLFLGTILVNLNRRRRSLSDVEVGTLVRIFSEGSVSERELLTLSLHRRLFERSVDKSVDGNVLPSDLPFEQMLRDIVSNVVRSPSAALGDTLYLASTPRHPDVDVVGGCSGVATDAYDFIAAVKAIGDPDKCTDKRIISDHLDFEIWRHNLTESNAIRKRSRALIDAYFASTRWSLCVEERRPSPRGTCMIVIPPRTPGQPLPLCCLPVASLMRLFLGLCSAGRGAIGMNDERHAERILCAIRRRVWCHRRRKHDRRCPICLLISKGTAKVSENPISHRVEDDTSSVLGIPKIPLAPRSATLGHAPPAVDLTELRARTVIIIGLPHRGNTCVLEGPWRQFGEIEMWLVGGKQLGCGTGAYQHEARRASRSAICVYTSSVAAGCAMSAYGASEEGETVVPWRAIPPNDNALEIASGFIRRKQADSTKTSPVVAGIGVADSARREDSATSIASGPPDMHVTFPRWLTGQQPHVKRGALARDRDPHCKPGDGKYSASQSKCMWHWYGHKGHMTTRLLGHFLSALTFHYALAPSCFHVVRALRRRVIRCIRFMDWSCAASIAFLFAFASQQPVPQSRLPSSPASLPVATVPLRTSSAVVIRLALQRFLAGCSAAAQTTAACDSSVGVPDQLVGVSPYLLHGLATKRDRAIAASAVILSVHRLLATASQLHLRQSLAKARGTQGEACMRKRASSGRVHHRSQRHRRGARRWRRIFRKVIDPFDCRYASGATVRKRSRRQTPTAVPMVLQTKRLRPVAVLWDMMPAIAAEIALSFPGKLSTTGSELAGGFANRSMYVSPTDVRKAVSLLRVQR
eukprot:TRINITY_DN21724_c0_g1_i1.p1 TRINITY_DN21724_c0_g1~~TRINITY_DN21724_c0_g1_i1.p1  ORF type:complete len:934 (+),score=0.14 TRINITY_DN21724_c0_g1_i1:182-2803(+)